MITNPVTLFFALVAGHALCDYPLQGDFLARAKNHRSPIAGVPAYQALYAHALIHAAMVAVLTDSFILGACEFVVHAAIDYAKCEGVIGYDADQMIHVLCKALWVVAVIP